MKEEIERLVNLINNPPSTRIILMTCDGYGEPLELSPEDVELIQEKTTETEDEHWQDVRERAAIAALQGLLTNSSKVGKIVDYTMSAVDYADALVEQLKKNKV